jgi:hypothetical protein
MGSRNDRGVATNGGIARKQHAAQPQQHQVEQGQLTQAPHP